MSRFSKAAEYALSLADKLDHMELDEFFTNVHDKFYPDIDISFMGYFLEICEHEDEFIVHHDKLVEYGIMTSIRTTAHIGERLDKLDLIENEDYLLSVNRQLRPQGGTSDKKIYMLTPDAFKICLMNARQHSSDKGVNPKIYNAYYLLLEKMFKLYNLFRTKRLEKLNSMKDDKIDRLEKKIDKQSDEMKKQSEEIQKLLAYGKKTTEDCDEMKEELTDVKHTLIKTESKLDTTKEKVSIIADHLVKKSYTSTKNPIDKKLVHHAMVMIRRFKSGKREFKFTACQQRSIGRAITDGTNSKFKMFIEPFYQANGIDYRQNVRHALDELVERRNREINPKLDEFLTELETDVAVFNKDCHDRATYRNTNTKLRLIEYSEKTNRYVYVHTKKSVKGFKLRDYEEEKALYIAEHFDDLELVDALFTEGTTTMWKPNKYISLEEVIDIFKNTNADTQASPYEDSE